MAGFVELAGYHDTSGVVNGTECFCPSRPSADHGVVPVFPRHGGHWVCDDCHLPPWVFFTSATARCTNRRWLLLILVFSVLGPQIANQLGCLPRGRTPAVDCLSPDANTGRPLSGRTSQCGADVADPVHGNYFLLFAVFIYLLNDKIQHGPDDADLTPSGKLHCPQKPNECEPTRIRLEFPF